MPEEISKPAVVADFEEVVDWDYILTEVVRLTRRSGTIEVDLNKVAPLMTAEKDDLF